MHFVTLKEGSFLEVIRSLATHTIIMYISWYDIKTKFLYVYVY